MTEAAVRLIDGEYADVLPADDRGLNYGDGLFETIRIKHGHARHWPLHMARLRWGCERLGLPQPDWTVLAAERDRLCAQADAVLKLVWTAGSGGRGYRRPAQLRPRRILSRHPLIETSADPQTQGIRVHLCQTSLSAQPRLAGLKHLQRLEQVLAQQEWDPAQADEGLMQDEHGRVICGTMSNLFMVKQGMLYTPPVDRCGVAGTTRVRVWQAAQALAIPVRREAWTAAQCLQADELFLTNAVRGLRPVRQLDEQRLPDQWPILQRLLNQLDQMAALP
jgi:4-amino-4-deoxychorismate lyase